MGHVFLEVIGLGCSFTLTRVLGVSVTSVYGVTLALTPSPLEERPLPACPAKSRASTRPSAPAQGLPMLLTAGSNSSLSGTLTDFSLHISPMLFMFFFPNFSNFLSLLMLSHVSLYVESYLTLSAQGQDLYLIHRFIFHRAYFSNEDAGFRKHIYLRTTSSEI